MAMLCICGVCIPYSVIWPVILLALKSVWDFFFPSSKKGKEANASSPYLRAKSISTSCIDLSPSPPDEELVKRLKKLGAFTGAFDYSEDMMPWDDFIDTAHKLNKLVIIKFTAKWCKPCKALEPFFNNLAESPPLQRAAFFVNLDVDACENIAAKYCAIALPFIVCVGSKQGGKEQGKGNGEAAGYCSGVDSIGAVRASLQSKDEDRVRDFVYESCGVNPQVAVDAGLSADSWD